VLRPVLGHGDQGPAALPSCANRGAAAHRTPRGCGGVRTGDQPRAARRLARRAARSTGPEDAGHLLSRYDPMGWSRCHGRGVTAAEPVRLPGQVARRARRLEAGRRGSRGTTGADGGASLIASRTRRAASSSRPVRHRPCQRTLRCAQRDLQLFERPSAKSPATRSVSSISARPRLSPADCPGDFRDLGPVGRRCSSGVPCPGRARWRIQSTYPSVASPLSRTLSAAVSCCWTRPKASTKSTMPARS
jgi:hypothetical protein